MKTREEIIQEARRLRNEARQCVWDTSHWNEHVRKPDELPIDPDPDGILADIEIVCTALIERAEATS